MAVDSGRMALPLRPRSADVDKQAMRVESFASRQVRPQRFPGVREGGADVTNGAANCDSTVPDDIAIERALQADVQLGCHFKRDQV